jgi:hypothetical protein
MAQEANRLLPVGLGVALLGHLVAHVEMAREPVDVAVVISIWLYVQQYAGHLAHE